MDNKITYVSERPERCPNCGKVFETSSSMMSTIFCTGCGQKIIIQKKSSNEVEDINSKDEIEDNPSKNTVDLNNDIDSVADDSTDIEEELNNKSSNIIDSNNDVHSSSKVEYKKDIQKSNNVINGKQSEKNNNKALLILCITLGVLLVSIFLICSGMILLFLKPSNNKPNEEEVVVEIPKHQLYIELSSEDNLLFNKYDMEIYLDDEEIGTVSNGKIFALLLEVDEGEHVLKIQEVGSTSNSTKKTITVNNDLSFKCDISHGGSIEMLNIVSIDSIEGALKEFDDYKGMILSEAVSELETKGYTDISYEPYNDIWNTDNWIITNQNIESGTSVYRNEKIVFDCQKFEEYIVDVFIGKTVSEAIKLAEQDDIKLIFVDDELNDISSQYYDLTEEEQNSIYIAKISKSLGDEDLKSVWVQVSDNEQTTTEDEGSLNDEEESVVEEQEVEEVVEEPKEEVKEDIKPVYYSTNDRDGAEEGNKGVFAYRSRGTEYYIYYIIDFDSGYVYRFVDGNGDETYDRVKIDSGTLNDVVIITYHDGNDEWSYGLHFKYANMPDHLILQEESGFEYDFYPTDLDDALKLRDSKTKYDY